MNDVNQMQRMPEIWDERKFWTSVKEIKGMLAYWGIQQSPYGMPENLDVACREISECFETKADAIGFFETNCRELRDMIRTSIDRCPTILSWNIPKKGDHHIAFSSRYFRPHPDYDFIDLDALARNMSHSITVAKKYNQAQDDQAQNDSLG